MVACHGIEASRILSTFSGAGNHVSHKTNEKMLHINQNVNDNVIIDNNNSTVQINAVDGINCKSHAHTFKVSYHNFALSKTFLSSVATWPSRPSSSSSRSPCHVIG